MDKLLEHCGSKFSGERAMDSNDQEKERGITITSKYTRLYYKVRKLVYSSNARIRENVNCPRIMSYM